MNGRPNQENFTLARGLFCFRARIILLQLISWFYGVIPPSKSTSGRNLCAPLGSPSPLPATPTLQILPLLSLLQNVK